MKADVIGLPVENGLIKAEDLANWIEARDAACAEYLAPALRKYLETGKDVKE